MPKAQLLEDAHIKIMEVKLTLEVMNACEKMMVYADN